MSTPIELVDFVSSFVNNADTLANAPSDASKLAAAVNALSNVASLAGSYIAAGGSAQSLVGLSFQYGGGAIAITSGIAVSLMDIGDRRQAYDANPTSENQRALTLSTFKFGFQLEIALLAGGLAIGGGLAAAMMVAGIAYGLSGLGFDVLFDTSSLFGKLLGVAGNVLTPVFRDPLVIDLDGDGIELTALGVAGQPGASNVFFDYDRDGFAERTGWVSPDDGMLAMGLH